VCGIPVNIWKFLGSAVIWATYGGILLLRHFRRLPAKRTAAASMLVFALALIMLPAIQYLSSAR
jgi:hypothetical protein